MPAPLRYKNESLAQFIERCSYFLSPTGCRIWTRGRDEDGYAKYKEGGGHSSPKAVHRIVWELVNGPIPDGLFCLHKCDTPPCIEIDHLFIGTPADNMADRHQKGRYPKGMAHPMCKLTNEKALAIRIDPRLLREIAADYGVSIKTVCGIRRGKFWTHI